MAQEFEQYQPRKIKFHQVLAIDDWKVKVYTISINKVFQPYGVLENAIKALPKWLKKAEKSAIPTHKMAFLIVHEAREGVLILINWWTGGEMIETEVYFSKTDATSPIINTPYKGKALICIWELEIFAIERKAWIDHILLKADHPNFSQYLNTVLKNH